jgi:hypothetical protein
LSRDDEVPPIFRRLRAEAVEVERSRPWETRGEIEAAICEAVSRFEQDYMGRGPKDIHAHLLGDLLVVRLQGVLTAAEQHLVRSLNDKGRDLLKQGRPCKKSCVSQQKWVSLATRFLERRLAHGCFITITGRAARR